MPRWVRIVTWFGIAVVVIATYLVFFGVQTAFVLEEHYFGWKYPEIWQVPAELPDTSVSNSAGQKLSYLKCEFEVPWSDLDGQETKLFNGWQTIAFQTGKNIVLQTFPAKERLGSLATLGQKVDAEALRKLRHLYGDETLRSDYEFTRAVLELTPDSVSIFMPRKEAVRAMMLLLLKQFMMHDADSGIFSIQTSHFRGFQFGNPQSRPHEVVDELFSDDERVEFTFACRGKGSDECISQPEINRILQSVCIVR
jgi:hypothetical protein